MSALRKQSRLPWYSKVYSYPTFTVIAPIIYVNSLAPKLKRCPLFLGKHYMHCIFPMIVWLAALYGGDKGQGSHVNNSDKF